MCRLVNDMQIRCKLYSWAETADIREIVLPCLSVPEWIVGACKGSGCGKYDGAPDIQKYEDSGSDLLVDYVASYQWNKTSKNWQIVKDSSFNADGSKSAFDCAKPSGGLDEADAWIHPQGCWTSRNDICIISRENLECCRVYAEPSNFKQRPFNSLSQWWVCPCMVTITVGQLVTLVRLTFWNLHAWTVNAGKADKLL